MVEKNKKIFPKIKKHLKNFLSDESGEITKKDALGLAAGASLLSGVGEVSAGYDSDPSDYTNIAELCRLSNQNIQTQLNQCRAELQNTKDTLNNFILAEETNSNSNSFESGNQGSGNYVVKDTGEYEIRTYTDKDGKRGCAYDAPWYCNEGSFSVTLAVPSFHVSGLVNGHISNDPMNDVIIKHGSHSSHGSHGSHGSHASRR